MRKSAVVVGAGYIGLEMAEALRARGLAVTILERLPTVLPTVDAELGTLVHAELERHRVTVHAGTAVSAIRSDTGILELATDAGIALRADLVPVVVGVRPETRLGREAGIPAHATGALVVDRRMNAGLPGVFAAGDCAVTYDRLLATHVCLPLGTTAHKQGRIAGENAVGGDRLHEGSLGTQVVRAFELAIARTGLRDAEAAAAGFEPLTISSRGYDHNVYYPGAREIAVRLTGDRRSDVCSAPSSSATTRARSQSASTPRVQRSTTR